MLNRNETEAARQTWTPDVIIQAFKEIVTAILGLILVGYTLYIAKKTFDFAGQQQITDAKDVLLLMLGLAGVVIGYYFGRVPADARATQAQEQANAATAQTEQVHAQALVINDRVEQVMDKVAPGSAIASARGVGVAPSDNALVADLQKIRDDLRNLAAVSSRRR